MLTFFELINFNDLRQSVSSNGLSWTNSSGFTIENLSNGVWTQRITFSVLVIKKTIAHGLISLQEGCTSAWVQKGDIYYFPVNFWYYLHLFCIVHHSILHSTNKRTTPTNTLSSDSDI